jgi:hypothetical protein
MTLPVHGAGATGVVFKRNIGTEINKESRVEDAVKRINDNFAA